MWVFLFLSLAGACQTNETCPSKLCLDNFCACQISTPDNLKPHNETCKCEGVQCHPSSKDKYRVDKARFVQVDKDNQQYCFKSGCDIYQDGVVGYVILIAGATTLLVYICVSVVAFVLLKKDGETGACKKAWQRGFCILNEKCKKSEAQNSEAPSPIKYKRGIPGA